MHVLEEFPILCINYVLIHVFNCALLLNSMENKNTCYKYYGSCHIFNHLSLIKSRVSWPYFVVTFASVIAAYTLWKMTFKFLGSQARHKMRLILLFSLLTLAFGQGRWGNRHGWNNDDNGFDLDWFWMGSNLRSIGK